MKSLPLNTNFVDRIIPLRIKVITCALFAYAATVVVAFAQERKILGRLLDKQTQKPIREASIEVEGTSSKALSNYLGYFELRIDSTAHVMMILHPEFKPLRIVIPTEDKFKLSMEKIDSAVAPPKYLGGFYNHISSNVHYPAEARRMKVEGVVWTTFSIDSAGVPADVLISRDVGYGCGVEIVRVIKALPPDIGRTLVKETSSNKFLLPCHFGLGQEFTSGPAISAGSGEFVLQVVNITALGIERPGGRAGDGAQPAAGRAFSFIGFDSYVSLSTALKNKHSAKVLSLVDNGLTEFPVGILELRNLEFLDLEKNKLTVLPAEIDKLDRLTGLYLYDNRLQKLPASVQNLRKLKALSLASNQFESIPHEVFTLERLEELDLSGNKLQQIPPGIVALKNLRILALSENALQTLPVEIFQLKNLEQLFIKGNQISADELARLKAALKKVQVVY